QFEQFGIPFTVNEIHRRIEPTQLLTDTQLELVRAAIEQGYYDTPRRCSLTDLAAESDLAKSTCSETLHRAEEKIIKQFVENLPGSRPKERPCDAMATRPRTVASSRRRESTATDDE